MFNWFSLDFVYYPVSGIMWLWYKLFGLILGPTNFFAWGLAVMFLVFSLRVLLYKPFVRQIRTTRQMQELQPQIKALQKKYGKDRQRMALEMQKLQREHGFNPILGCLPMLAQIPVFIGLYHVLRSFNRTTGGFGQPHLTVAENRANGNYVFSPPREISSKTLTLVALLGQNGLVQAKIIPNVISGCRPVVLSGAPASQWLGVVAGYCRGLGTTMDIAGDRGFINGNTAGTPGAHSSAP